jgi:hypothetical protein
MPQSMTAKLVGMKFNRGADLAISLLPRGVPQVVELERDPNNAYDRNAVKVFLPIAPGIAESLKANGIMQTDALMLGHIEREKAAVLSPRMLIEETTATLNADKWPLVTITFGERHEP